MVGGVELFTELYQVFDFCGFVGVFETVIPCLFVSARGGTKVEPGWEL